MELVQNVNAGYLYPFVIPFDFFVIYEIANKKSRPL